MKEEKGSYRISHDWGDPREPDYENDLKVAYVRYIEKDICLCFRAIGKRPDEDGKKVSLVLEAPANARVALGKQWSQKDIIFGRVADYLEGQISGAHGWGGIKGPFERVFVDASKVPNWLEYSWQRILKKVNFVSSRLPAVNALPFLLVGLFCAQGPIDMLDWLPAVLFRVAPLASGLLALIALWQAGRWKMLIISYPHLTVVWRNKEYDWRLETLKTFLRLYGFQFALAIMVALYLIFYGYENMWL